MKWLHPLFYLTITHSIAQKSLDTCALGIIEKTIKALGGYRGLTAFRISNLSVMDIGTL